MVFDIYSELFLKLKMERSIRLTCLQSCRRVSIFRDSFIIHGKYWLRFNSLLVRSYLSWLSFSWQEKASKSSIRRFARSKELFSGLSHVRFSGEPTLYEKDSIYHSTHVVHENLQFRCKRSGLWSFVLKIAIAIA